MVPYLLFLILALFPVLPAAATHAQSTSPYLSYSKTPRMDCGRPFDSVRFCAKEPTDCKQSTCWNPLASLSGYNAEEKEKAFLTAKMSFNRLISDPSLQQMCCGDGIDCKNWFLQTRLKIQTGLGPQEALWKCFPAQRAIILSEARVLGCENRECIEGIFLHELGRVCQHFRSGTAGFDFKRICSMPGSSIDDFDQTVGEETRRCVYSALEAERAQAVARHQEVCFGNWEVEAFADVIFSAWWKRPAHWAWSCGGNEDSQHADPKSYMKCVVGPDRAEPRRTVCEGL